MILLLVTKQVFLGILFECTNNLIRNTPYEEDDKEADDIYESVANRMAERRMDKKEDLEVKRVEMLDREHMDVKRQFEDLKVYF